MGRAPASPTWWWRRSTPRPGPSVRSGGWSPEPWRRPRPGRRMGGGHPLELCFPLLQRGDVDADADNAAVGGAPLDDLAPVAVVIGAGEVGVCRAMLRHALGHPGVDVVADVLDVTAGGVRAQQLLERRARHEQLRRLGKIAVRRAVADDDTVVGIAQQEARRNALDRLGEAVMDQRRLAFGRKP